VLAITTDYLVVLAEDNEGDDAAFAEDEDEDDEVQAADAGVKGTESAASTGDAGRQGPAMGSRLAQTAGWPSSNASKRRGLLGARLATPMRRSISCISSPICISTMSRHQTLVAIGSPGTARGPFVLGRVQAAAPFGPLELGVLTGLD